MKKLWPLLMICLLVLVSCETYCERNFPSETVILLPPEPSIDQVEHSWSTGPLFATLQDFKAGSISDDVAASQILSDYSLPLVTLIEAWKAWAEEVKAQVE